MMRGVALLLTLLAPMAWAGDELLMPEMRAGSAYESTHPSYRVVGMEDRGADHTLFVVARPADVLTKDRLNRIISDIQRRDLGFTAVNFYTSVRDEPRSPTFAVYDFLGVYRPEHNKTYYGIAAKNLYGAWANGPKR